MHPPDFQVYIKYLQSRKNERPINALMKVMANNYRASISLSFLLEAASNLHVWDEWHGDLLAGTFESLQQVPELRCSLCSLLLLVNVFFVCPGPNICKSEKAIAVKHKCSSVLRFNLSLICISGGGRRIHVCRVCIPPESHIFRGWVGSCTYAWAYIYVPAHVQKCAINTIQSLKNLFVTNPNLFTTQDSFSTCT